MSKINLSALVIFICIGVTVIEAQRRPSSKLAGNRPTVAASNNFAKAKGKLDRGEEDDAPLDPGCPDRHGRYPTGQCDAYIECKNGKAEEKLCPDGLLFDPKTQENIFSFPCSYPIDVNCLGREALQTPQATDECPHQFGYYRVGDENNCGQFINCVDGRGFEFNCPDGLAFNEDTYRCDWADEVDSCNAEAFIGFTCPSSKLDLAAFGLGDQEYTYHRDPNDCQKYFLCKNGRPRKLSCGPDQAFNEETRSCEDADEVEGCSLEPKFDIDVRFKEREQINAPTSKPQTLQRKVLNGVGKKRRN